MKLEFIEKDLYWWAGDIPLYESKLENPIIYYLDENKGPVRSDVKRVLAPDVYWFKSIEYKYEMEHFPKGLEPILEQMDAHLDAYLKAQIQALADCADKARPIAHGEENTVRVVQFNRLGLTVESSLDGSSLHFKAIHNFVAEAL